MDFFKSIFSRPEFSGVDFAATVKNGAEPDQRTLIQMLHQEIETAPERIIREAKQSKLELQASLEIPTPEIEIPAGLAQKVDRLGKLGFTNSQEKAELFYWMTKKAGAANEKNQNRLDIQKLTHVMNDAEYYQKNYPFAKFLTIEELNRICQKYGLIFAPAHAYIKEIPDKNLAEIEKAQELRPFDLPGKAISRGMFATSISVHEALQEARVRGIRPFEPRTVEELLAYLNGDYRFPKPNKHIRADHVNMGRVSRANPHAADALGLILHERWRPAFDPTMNEAYTNLQNAWGAIEFSVSRGSQRVQNRDYELSAECGFHIAAPIDHFKLDPSKMEKVGEYGYRVKEDPIVFRYCRGGILVDSKWGLEASDPALINPINN